MFKFNSKGRFSSFLTLNESEFARVEMGKRSGCPGSWCKICSNRAFIGQPCKIVKLTLSCFVTCHVIWHSKISDTVFQAKRIQVS